ncbi:MAG: glycosyltransferase [Candidatus Omnitrophica bacterium]|nr:glycosyltransferase [Candidatus Omnitrophota bacterium]
MDALSSILFWGCFGILIYIYAGYILILQIKVRLHPFRHKPDESHQPAISILFAARNEMASLPAKMESIRNLRYPREKVQTLIASDASTDGADEYLAAQDDVHFTALKSHQGKNASLNAILPHAKGDVLFFTDANTILHPGCLQAAARHFHDPHVGLIVGELTFKQEENWNAVGRGAGLYWKYENHIKRLESRLGSLLVGGGSLLIVRRSLVETLDPRIANDLEIPARVGAKGYKILYEPECLGFEKAHTRAGEEWGRTSRIVARGLRGFVVLLPIFLKTPMRFWQFVSHKFLRWFTLPLVLGAMLGAWALRDNFIPGAFFYLSLVGMLLAGIGLCALPYSPASKWMRPFTLAAHMTIMHCAALWGILKALFGRTPATWDIPESTRE